MNTPNHKPTTMDELTKKKTIAETRKINFELFFNTIKAVLLMAGSVIVFKAINEPESVLNRKLSIETVNQNRAKLILELLNNYEEPEDVLLGLSVIRKSYPNNESYWISSIENLFVTKTRFTKIEDIKNIPEDTPNYDKIMQLVEIIENRNKLKQDFELLLIAEQSSGQSLSTSKISSVSYQGTPQDLNETRLITGDKMSHIIKLEQEIQQFTNSLDSLGINLDL